MFCGNGDAPLASGTLEHPTASMETGHCSAPPSSNVLSRENSERRERARETEMKQQGYMGVMEVFKQINVGTDTEEQEQRERERSERFIP